MKHIILLLLNSLVHQPSTKNDVWRVPCVLDRWFKIQFCDCEHVFMQSRRGRHFLLQSGGDFNFKTSIQITLGGVRQGVSWWGQSRQNINIGAKSPKNTQCHWLTKQQSSISTNSTPPQQQSRTCNQKSGGLRYRRRFLWSERLGLCLRGGWCYAARPGLYV